MAGGGSETTSVEIPAFLQEAAQRNLARADQVSQIGYTPYYGPDVAAMTPMQIAAMQNTGAAASAFGLPTVADPMAGMPAPQTFAGGVQGYSSAPLYQQSLEALRVNNPGQYAAIQSLFVDPRTGAAPFGITSMPMGGPMGGAAPRSYGQPMREGPPQGSAASRNTSFDTYSTPAAAAARAAAGSRGSSGMSSYLPGGVNTRNPLSAVNQAAARLTSKPQGAPTQKDRPAKKSTSTSKSVSDSRTAAASKPASKPDKKPTEKKSSPSRGGNERR